MESQYFNLQQWYGTQKISQNIQQHTQPLMTLTKT